MNRTDGTRAVEVKTPKKEGQLFALSVCRNGFQTTTIDIDETMLVWLRDCIDGALVPQLQEDEERKLFEAWVSAPPFEKGVTQWPNNAYWSACPRTYLDIAVELAWRAWKEAKGIE